MDNTIYLTQTCLQEKEADLSEKRTTIATLNNTIQSHLREIGNLNNKNLDLEQIQVQKELRIDSLSVRQILFLL